MRCGRRWIALLLALGRSCCRPAFIVLFLLSPVFISCGGGDSGGGNPPPNITVQGNAQKGPFITGSSVQVLALNTSLMPTGDVFTSAVLDERGSFRISVPTAAPFVEIVANGYYYDELPPSIRSTDPITLSSIAPAGATVDVRLNVLTTLMKGRQRRLVGQGMSFSTASVQAKNELLAVFDLPTSTMDDPTLVDVTRSGQGDAALIATSAILQQLALDRSKDPGEKVLKLGLALSELGTDFEDGTIAAQQKQELARAARRLDSLSVRNSLQTILANLGLTGTAPDITTYVTPLAAQYPWQPSVQQPASAGPVACAVNDKIYLVGNSTHEFDPATQTWTSRRARPPTAGGVSTCSAVNGKVYAIGATGSDPATDLVFVQEYDPGTDSWASRQSTSTLRRDMCSAVVNGKIYVMGGFHVFALLGLAFATAQEYDPATDTWGSLASMPIGTSGAGCATANGLVYVVGGASSVSVGTAGATFLNTVQVYNPATDMWSAGTPMPLERGAAAIATVAGKFYLIGGFGKSTTTLGGNVLLDDNDEYDPLIDTWVVKAKLAFPVTGEAVAVGGLVYYFMTDGRVEIYDPAKG